MPVDRWDVNGRDAYVDASTDGEYVLFTDYLSAVRKLEHIIEGLNAQLLVESEEIHDLQEAARRVQRSNDYAYMRE